MAALLCAPLSIWAQSAPNLDQDYVDSGSAVYQRWADANTPSPGKAGAKAVAGDGTTVSYTAFNGTGYTDLAEYRGKYTRLLLNPLWMTTTTETQRLRFLDYADKTYLDFRRMIGKDPGGAGLLTIATVTTCGYGCGVVGGKGVELDPGAGLRDDILWTINTNGESGVLTHEFAHNFDVFHNHLAYWADWAHAWTRLTEVLFFYQREGFASSPPALRFRSARTGTYDRYMADTAKTWANCVTGGTTCNDADRNSIWAGLMYRFVELHGLPGLLRYMEYLKNYTASNGVPTTNEAKEDLNVEAMAYGAQRNLGCYADRWRWNASPALRTRMTSQWGASNSFCQDSDFDGFSALDGDANDANPSIKPGGTEVPGNNVDDNFNGLVDEIVWTEPAGGDFAENQPVSVPGAIAGSISATTDFDRFLITLSQPTWVSFTLRSLGTFKGWVFVYNQDNRTWYKFAFADTTGSGNVTVELGAGVWMFGVEMNNNSNPGAYQVDVEPVPAPTSWAAVSMVGTQLRLRSPLTAKLLRAPDTLEVWMGRFGVIRSMPWSGSAEVNIDLTSADAPGAEPGAPYSFGFRALAQGLPVVDWTDLTEFNWASSGPASVAVSGGTPQSTQVSTAFSAPLRAVVRDSSNNPVAGATVTFAAPTSGASATLSAPSAVTDVSGVASVTATANGTSGSYNVAATVAGASAPAVFALTNTAGSPGSITASAGTPQNAAVGSPFATSLQVTVRDASNNPVSGATVTFTTPPSGASAALSSPTALTNASGVASVAATANGTAGSYTVSATAPGVAAPATFALTNQAGTPSTIAVQGGSPQSAAVSTAFASPLQAVVRDSNNNPVPGVIVTFATPGSGASATLSSATATTNTAGVASVTAAANSTAGSYNVTASAPGVASPATFALTNQVGSPGSIAASGGTPQTAAVSTAFSTPLQAIVRDSSNNPLAGVTVTFTAPASGASAALSSGTAVTNASGVASVTATANGTAGSYTVSAGAPGVASPAVFSLTNTAGSPGSIAAASGTPQTTAVGAPFSAPLQVTVRDASNNPVSGVVVTFTAPSSGAGATLSSATATTNAAGSAAVTATANSTAGTYNVSASAPGVASPAVFSLTNQAGNAAAIAAASGTPQTTGIGTAFGAPLQAIVRDANNNPVAGVTVTFTAPLSGPSATLSSSTATTNASGIAQVTVTANGTSGTYNVSATAPNVASPAQFALTNQAGSASSVAATLGTPQSAPVGNAFSTALQATVRDASNNPVQGVVVTFTAPASGASATLSSATATTNASGIASVTASANGTAGTYQVTAAAAGVATGVVFTLTNTPGAPATVTVSAGSPQSAVVGTPFAAPLEALVRDATGNPVSGVSVTFAAPGSGASAALSRTTATTNAAGLASTGATANTSFGSYTVTATAPGVSSPAVFTLSNVAGTPATILVAAGTPQAASLGARFTIPLQAAVRDASNNPVPGVTVTFAAPGAGASASLSASSVTTDGGGFATVTATANGTPGAYNVTATVGGVAGGASFTLSNLSAAAGSIAAISGISQSAASGAQFPAALRVIVRDASSTPVAGATVTFTAPEFGATAILSSATAVTDSTGSAQITATAGSQSGFYTVSAYSPGAAMPANFTLNNLGGSTVTISPTAGTPQSAYVRATFTTGLQATVRDSAGRAIPGVPVTFTAPGGLGATATLSATTVNTDSAGQASVTATANNVTGTYNVTATTPGAGAPATFVLTNMTMGPPPPPAIVSPATKATLANTIVNYAWNPVSGATRYELCITDLVKLSQFRVSLLGATSAVYTFPAGAYRMDVQSCNDGGCSSPTTNDFTVQPTTVPSVAPTGLACQVTNDGGQNRLSCNWSAVTGAHFYFLNVVQQGAGPGGGALTVAGIQAGTTNASVLIPNGTASALVRACTGDGCGPYSADYRVTAGNANPNVPVLGEPFAGSSVDSGSDAPKVLFSWNRVAGDNGTNYTYRLYVQDFSRNRAALDVITTSNFYSAYFNPGTRYDAVVIAIPNGGSPQQGPASAFLVRGRPPKSPVATEPSYGSAVTPGADGKVHVAWTPVVNNDGSAPTRKYQYYFNGPRPTGGVTTSISADLALPSGSWIGIMRACLTGTDCVETSDTGWGPWNNSPTSEGGQAAFTVR